MGTATVTKHSGEIAFRNDVFRRKGHHFMVTDEVQWVPDVCGLIEAVQSYTKFDANNDPHNEHDFGSLEWHGRKVFWKIDYYDAELKYWKDPLSSDCHRVLTIMLASEY